MTRLTSPRAASGRRGATSFVVILVIIVLAGFAAALSMMSWSTHRERQGSVAQTRVRYAAEGIVDEGLARLRTNGIDSLRTQTGFPRTVADVSQTLTVTYGDTDATVADDLIRLVGVANHDGVRSAVESYIRTTPIVDPFLLAFGDLSVALDSNATIDAYDSSLGTWQSQIDGVRSGISYSNSGSSLGSNGTISVAGNGQVFGDARSGPGYSVTTSGNGYVSGTESSAPAAIPLPPIVVPSLPSNGVRSVGNTATVTIPSGTYHWTRFEVGGDARVTIQGPATIVADDWFIDADARVTFDTSTGPISVFATGPMRFLANTVTGPASGRPKDLKIQASGVNQPIVFDSNAKLTGQLYAPSSTVELLSNAHVWGSVAARRLDLDSNGCISADLDLLRSAAVTGHTFTKVSWRVEATLL